ncbi:MAG TPA: UBP-type zinc finger domain-containing protein [Kofleriaceae bacterium]|nr:UBP-type zinc finger domain-containing protein [Kofleriaceae bacterium]
MSEIRAVEPRTQGCEECLRTGQRWVELRLCQTCGHVGCCDSSPGKHASAHYHDTDHPIIKALHSGPQWYWCYVDEEYVQPEAPGASPSP